MRKRIDMVLILRLFNSHGGVDQTTFCTPADLIYASLPLTLTDLRDFDQLPMGPT